MAFEFKLDRQAPDDDAYAVTDGIRFVVDKATQEMIGDTTFQLDYSDDVGYVLRTPRETLAFAIRFAVST